METCPALSGRDYPPQQGTANMIHARHARHLTEGRVRHSDELLEFASQQDARLSIGAVAAAKATGTLTLGGVPGDTQTVTIGAKVYTFQTVLTNVNGNVLIGATAAASATNLFNAINMTGGGAPGVDYAAATTANTDVVATNGVAAQVLATAIVAGTAANAKATTSTVALGTWSAATLTGGVDGVTAAPFDALKSLTKNSADEIRAATLATALK